MFLFGGGAGFSGEAMRDFHDRSPDRERAIGRRRLRLGGWWSGSTRMGNSWRGPMGVAEAITANAPISVRLSKQILQACDRAPYLKEVADPGAAMVAAAAEFTDA